MTKKSIIFIEPSGNETNVFDNYMQLPLMGSLYFGTILHEEGYEVRILNENILSREIDPFEIKADVFCITALTVSANRAKLLAGQLKKIYPESMVVVGGIHASLLPEEFAGVADHVVVGEADDIIVDVVEGKFDEKIIQGSKPKDLEKSPLTNYSLMEGIGKLNMIPIMTSRGCPFDCNFCTVTKVFGRKFRMQSPARIVAEIENALSFFNTKDIFFYDDNFTANRERVNELCDLLIEKNIDITWSAQVRSDLAKDPELIEKMVEAGLTWVYVGFESIDDETLKDLHKSQTKSDIENAVRTLHKYGVSVHGMFMFGGDRDTVESISDTVKFAMENELETVQFMILTPFPGTEIYETIEKENRLFHKNWDYYNGMFAVFQPKTMSPVRLIKETAKAYRKFYSFRRTLLDALYLVFSIFLDAVVWNFKRAGRYGLDILFLRAGAKILVTRYSKVYDSYRKYLTDTERKIYLEQSGKKD
jgi:anaerobic magnesium-protoporphyrin IX monomethyl ester cyclase